MHNKKVIVIIPAFNEESTVKDVLGALSQTYPEFDLLVIDDCSRDRTALLAREGGATVISLPVNLGIGGAVQTGFQYARAKKYDLAIQFDADGQHDVLHIAKIVEPVLKGDLDLCIGSRFISTENTFQSSFLRKIGIRFFALLISFLTRQRLTDPTSGFRAFSSRLIRLFAEYYPVDFPEPESIVIAKHHHASIGEVPVIMHPRQGGRSSIRFLKTGYYMIKVTVAILLCLLKKRRVLHEN